MSFNRDNDNRGNRADTKSMEREIDVTDDEMESAESEGSQDSSEPLVQTLSLSLSKSLVRKLRDYAREEGVPMEDLAMELIAEGVVLRAWEIVERKHAMRGGNQSQGNQGNFNRSHNNGNSGGNAPHGNTAHGHSQQQRQFQGGGNKQAQRKLARQARQHANSMDLLQDKAAFLEYVRSQEQKRR